MKYSVVEKKSLVEENPAFTTTVKDGKGEWKRQIICKGTKEDCYKRQKKLESILSKAAELDAETEELEKKEGPPQKRKKVEDSREEDEDINSTDNEDTEDQENSAVNEEVKRVNALLKAKKSIKVNNSSGSEKEVTVSETLLRELFNGVYERLDTMTSLLQQQKTERMIERQPIPESRSVSSPRARIVLNEDSVPSSPASAKEIEAFDTNCEEFIYNGTNLLTHVNAKAKKPRLYATALLSVLFSDEEMRSGIVEPKDGGVKKPALDQTKVDLLKRCVKAKYGERIMEKKWTEIKTSLNQKCLDKLKAFRKGVKEETSGNKEEIA